MLTNYKIVIYMFYELVLLMCFLKSEKLHNLIKLGREFHFFCCQICKGVETKSCSFRFGHFQYIVSTHAV